MTDSDSLGHRPENAEPPSSPAPAPVAARGLSILNRIRSMLVRGTASLREDLQEALDEPGSAETGDFSESERTILQNVLKLGNVTVGDVMVERSDIQAIEADVNLGTLLAKFRDVGHSRLPVYEDGLDNILGFIHVKDALRRITDSVNDPEKDVPVKLVSPALRSKIGKLDLVRTAMFVPTFMPVGDLLQSMRASRVHMAIVIDEYGGTDGLVTIEDLLEAVVGEIEDEHDEFTAALIRKVGEDTYIANARAELADVQALLGPDFDPGTYAEEVDTVGGLVFDLAGHVPKRGEKVGGLKGFEFEVLAADSRRIKRLRIRRVPEGGAPEEPLAITDQRSEGEKAAS
ncbi:hemolysin family protein [Devosia sp. 1635]|uniref:hemolysin family protein n=1 Tax=Devosia sp. 1635 TaxID=2726066 RepID=UPI0020BE4819|nr:hemolysin family protein [Devosia sp. 1635]